MSFRAWLNVQKTAIGSVSDLYKLAESYMYGECMPDIEVIKDREATFLGQLNARVKQTTKTGQGTQRNAYEMQQQFADQRTQGVPAPAPGFAEVQIRQALQRAIGELDQVFTDLHARATYWRKRPKIPDKVSGTKGDLSGNKGTGFELWLVTRDGELVDAKRIGKDYYGHTGDSYSNHGEMRWKAAHLGELETAIKVALQNGKAVERVEMNDTRQPCGENCAIEVPKMFKKLNSDLTAWAKIQTPPIAFAGVRPFVFTFKDDDSTPTEDKQHVYFVAEDEVILLGDW